ncbi:MAG: glycosyltransferase family 25 protein [Aeromonas sp.]
MIPIFVISLTRSQDRRASIQKQMDQFGLKFTFWDACDGRTLGNLTKEKVDVELAQQLCGHPLSAGEVGCALSHISLYEMIVEQGIERAMILEDDVRLHMHFKKVVNAAINMSRSDIVLLIHGKGKKWPLLRSLPEGYRLAKYRSPSRHSKRALLSAAGYILTMGGAKKLLAHAYPVRMPADYLTGRLQMTGLIASGIEPCCLDVNEFTTTIENRAYGSHLKKRGNDVPSV